MKKFFLATLACAALALPAYAQSTPKVFTVDVQRVLNEFWEYQDARERVQGSVQIAEEERQQMEAEIRNLGQEIQGEIARSNNPALTDEAKAEAQQKAQEMTTSFEEKRQKYQVFVQTTQQNLNQQQQDVFGPIQEKVTEAVKTIAEEKGADMVLRTDGGVVLWADESFDISQTVIDVLNADAPNR